MRLLFFYIAGCTAGPVIRIDGSSSLYPMSEQAAREFAAREGANVAVGISGSAGGLKKLCRGEVDIAATSRRATPAESCGAREVAVRADEVVVIVHRSASFVDRLSHDELRAIWSDGSRVGRWSEVRPGWPDTPLRLYAPAPQSATFELFTLRVLGQARGGREDFYGSEDDYLLAYGVERDPAALGVVGAAYLRQGVRRIPVDVTLTRTLFAYVRSDAPPQVERFLAFLAGSAP